MSRPQSKTLLLFDIDGTLMTASGAGMRAMYRVARRMFGDDFNWDGVQVGGNLDPAIFLEAAQNNGLDDVERHHELFHEHYLCELSRELDDAGPGVRSLPGVHELLALLRDRARMRNDVVLGMLTGNYAKAVPIKLRCVGVDLDWFDVTAFGDEAPTRPDLVSLAMRRYRTLTGQSADPRRVVVIGDTPRDVAAAAAHGCVAFAVATGDHTVAELAAGGAEHVLRNLSDPAPLLAILDSA